MLTTAREWADAHPEAEWRAARSFIDQAPESPMGRLLLDTMAQLVFGDLLAVRPPIIRQLSDGDPTRFGFFHAATDRDAFVEHLLGRPVPMRPRYRSRAFRAHTEVRAPEGLVDAMGPARPEFRGLPLPEQVRRGREQIDDALGYLLRDDRGLLAGFRDLVRGPDAAELGVIQLLLAAMRDDPLWMLCGPALDAECAVVWALGPLGWVGFAWWDPSDIGARKHRRAVAARLRYLFDSWVCPWNRWSDDARRREAAMVLVGRHAAETVAALVDRLRRDHPLDYAEERDVTLRRLYRLNAGLRAERRRFAVALSQPEPMPPHGETDPLSESTDWPAWHDAVMAATARDGDAWR